MRPPFALRYFSFHQIIAGWDEMISGGRHTERALAIPKCENINSVHITAQLFRGGSLPWFGNIRTTLVPSVRRCKIDQVSALGIIVVDYMMLTPTTGRTSPLHPQ